MKATRNLILIMVGSAMVFFAIGAVLFGLCGGGVSLILFGVASAFMGVVVVMLGGYAVSVPMAIVVLLLIAVGVYIAGASGCAL